MKVSTLKKNPQNPRQIKGEKLELLKKSVGSFQKMMSLRPMIVDENNIVLGGNMRLAAIKALGLKEIPDDWVKQVTDLTPEEKAEFVIKDNNSFGEYDWDAIANDWTDYPLADWGLDVPGFEVVEEVGNADAEPQIDKAAELNKKWGVASGDLWQIGGHRLLCGDSTKREDVERLMDGQKARLCFTDPPYNVAYSGRGQNTSEEIANDDMSDDAFVGWLFLVGKMIDFATTENAACYLCHGDTSNKAIPFTNLFEQLGWTRSCTIIWAKNVASMGWQDYRGQHECISYGWKGKDHYFTEERTHTTLWDFNRDATSSYMHPTQKPVEVSAQAIKNSSQAGDVCFEPFAGSGSQLVACQNLNRKCYAIEISENYCAVILERMATAFPDIEIKKIDG